MPPIRDHGDEDTDYDFDERDTDEDDDMPPLVDNPPPMTYTFFTEMTPLSFANPSDTNTPSTSIPGGPDLLTPASTFSFAPSDDHVSVPSPHTPRTSHGKRRDASYIPRPPNAFILFRSSFIRSQQVTGKVEGSHSNLSKIIGMYWKTLPQAERDEWEEKARIAQAEHRRAYPDWRFRPGANALAKLKVKDGGGSPGPSTWRHRRIQAAKDPPDGGGNGDKEPSEGEELPEDTKGKGKARARPRTIKGKTRPLTKEEKRLSKIADFLSEGKKGVELELAVKEWEVARRNSKKAKIEKDTTTTVVETATCDPASPQILLSISSPAMSTSHPSGSSSTSASSSTAADSPALPFSTFSASTLLASAPRSTWSTPTTPLSDTLDTERQVMMASPSTHSIQSPVAMSHYDRHGRDRGHGHGNVLRSRSRSPVRSPHGSSSSQQHYQLRHEQPHSASPHPTRRDKQGHQPRGRLGPLPLTHMFKRSLSAPASNQRLSYPHPRHPVPLSSLPMPLSDDSSDHEVSGRGDTPTLVMGDRKDEEEDGDTTPTATVSGGAVPPPIAGSHTAFPTEAYSQHMFQRTQSLLPPVNYLLQCSTAHGHGYGHARRDTISLPFDAAHYQATHSHPVAPLQQQQQPIYQERREEQHSYYRSTRSFPHDQGYSTLTWQEEENRRRREVEAGYAYWWRDAIGGREVEKQEMYEPVRQGSFDAGSIDTEAGMGMGYETNDTTVFMDQFAHPSQMVPTDGSQVVNWTRQDGRMGLMAINANTDVDGEGSPFIGNVESSASSFISPTRSTISPVVVVESPTAIATASPSNAMFYPRPVTPITPITPFSSSFSSLAGWDGEPKSPEDLGSQKRSGWHDEPGSRWSNIQPLGLQGGSGTWGAGSGEGTAEGSGGMHVDGEEE